MGTIFNVFSSAQHTSQSLGALGLRLLMFWLCPQHQKAQAAANDPPDASSKASAKTAPHPRTGALVRRRWHRNVLRREGSPEEHTGPKVGVLSSPEGAAPLSDEEWEMVEPLIPRKPPAGRPYHDHRRVLGGILWVARTGSSWREMPEEEFGKWETA